MMSELIPSDVFSRLPERFRKRAREISVRVKEIDKLTVYCKPIAIRDAALRLRGQLRPQPDTDIAKFAEEFRLACSDLPEWAISEATNDYLSGRVENHTGQFMPTCAEFARHARSIIAPFVGERAGLRREAERLLDRAEDERRRELIELERMNPKQKEWIRELAKSVRAGSAASRSSMKHVGINQSTQERLDAMKVRHEEAPSRLAETRIVKGAKR